MNIYTHGFLVTSQKDVCTFTPCLSTSVGTARLTGKMSHFQKCFGVRLRSKLSTGETRKATGHNIKIPERSKTIKMAE